MKDFVVINFGEYFKSTKEKLRSKLNEEQNLIKVIESLYIFPTTHDEVEKYVEIMQLNSSGYCENHNNIEILKPFDQNCNWLTLKL